MRIAIVTTYPPSTGTLNEYAYHFVRFLRQKSDVSEIVLLTDSLPDDKLYAVDSLQDGGIPIQIIPCWRFGGWNNAWRILRAIQATHPDVVLFNLQFATFGSNKAIAAIGLLTPALVKAAGFATIVLLHNIMETVHLQSAGFGTNPFMERVIRFFGALSTRILLTADIVAVTIPKYVEILESKYHATNVILAPHGSFEVVPPPLVHPPSHVLQIMTFGKFGTYKKVEPLIEAFKLLLTRHPDLELVIAGTDSPNALGYLATVQRHYADVQGLHFTGYVAEEDVPRIFTNASIIVFPYTSTTGSSGVLHQAGTYGKPVVLPQLGDLAELIAEEGFVGEFFQADDAHSLAQALAILIDDPIRRSELGMRNYLAACGLPIADVVDWYILHAQALLGAHSSISSKERASSTV